MRARWYDPHTGTFLTPDPLGYRDSSNLYAFAGGDPVNGRDPLGMERPTGRTSRLIDRQAKIAFPKPAPKVAAIRQRAAFDWSLNQLVGAVLSIPPGKVLKDAWDTTKVVLAARESGPKAGVDEWVKQHDAEAEGRLKGLPGVRSVNSLREGGRAAEAGDEYTATYYFLDAGFSTANDVALLSGTIETLESSSLRPRTTTALPIPSSTGAPRAYNISTAGLTSAEATAIREYAQRTNAWLEQAGPQTIQSTQGELRSLANATARRERLRAARAGQPYQGQAGHVPDTAISGQATPPAGWLDMPGVSNQCCGGGLSSRVGQQIDVITVDGAVP